MIVVDQTSAAVRDPANPAPRLPVRVSYSSFCA